MLVQDKEKNLIAKPYNPNEIAKKDDQEQAQSMATTALLAQQQQMGSTDAYAKPLTNSMNTNSKDISPSFTQTAVPDKAVPGGGPMTFEPGSIT